MNKMLFLCVFLFCGVSYVGLMVPIPIIMNSGGGEMSETALHTMFIGMNLIFMVWYIIRSLIYVHTIKNNSSRPHTFFEYVIWDGSCGVADITTIFMATFNFVFLSAFFMIFIADIV